MRALRYSLLLAAIYLFLMGAGNYYIRSLEIRIVHQVIITFIISVYWLLRLRKGEGLPRTGLNTSIYVMVGIWFLGATLGLNPRVSAESMWNTLQVVAYFFIIVDLLQHGYQRIVMDTFFIICLVILSLTGFELYIYLLGMPVPGAGPGWLEFGLPPMNRLPVLTLAMGNSNPLAIFVVVATLLCFAWGWTSSRRDYRVILWSLALISALLLPITLSRGGIAAMATGLFTFGWLRLSQSTRLSQYSLRLRAGVWATGIGVAAVAIIALGALTDSSRQDLWQGAVRMAADHPITGVGPGMYGTAFREYRLDGAIRDHQIFAHNAYINMAAEFGLIGLAAVAVVIGLGLKLGWQNWQNSSGGRRIRIEACFAALIAYSTHSLVDTFTMVQLMLVFALLAAYFITPLPQSRLDAQPRTDKRAAWAMLALTLGYAAALMWTNQPYATYLASRASSDRETALAQAQLAIEQDNGLGLYPLNLVYLEAVYAENAAQREEAIADHQAALAENPDWDAGWLNLAALAEQQGDIETAMAALEQAYQIRLDSLPLIHQARIAEANGSLPDEAIVRLYASAMDTLPLASFWWETDLRRQAVESKLPAWSIDLQYRILAAHDPERLSELLPETPTTAADYWVLGEYALSVLGDAEQAREAFSTAVELSPMTGDNYVALSRSSRDDPEAMRYLLGRGELLGLTYENSNMLRAELSDDSAQRKSYLLRAVPQRSLWHFFSSIRFGRLAILEPLPSMGSLGPGRAQLQAWFDLTEIYLEEGDMDNAQRIAALIYSQAPYEADAVALMARMEDLEDLEG